MVLEESGEDRDAVWNLWSVPIGALGLWSKVLPSFRNNYYPFAKLLLACYEASVEVEHLTVGHQVTLHST